MAQTELTELQRFLLCSTPSTWVEAAVADIPLLLLDHAHCEKKAAASALGLIHRYPMHKTLLQPLSQLVREEMLHFEQVLHLLQARGISYMALPAGRYAASLKQWVRQAEPARLTDSLIVAAIIEARSCERFACLVPALHDTRLAHFYQRLLAAEARHFRMYLDFAAALTTTAEFASRQAFFLAEEAKLICSPDAALRFHSGVPQC